MMKNRTAGLVVATLAWVVAVAGCARSYDLSEGGGNAATGGGPLELPEDCEGEIRAGIAPKDLRCTGLYRDIEDKQISSAMRYFEPDYPLWSDSAGKKRWIFLPQGETIDASDPNNWRFPVGTRLFKEFSWKDRRVETRMYYKETKKIWIKSAYHWSDDESSAKRFPGGEVDVDGDPYYIPSPKECDQCHKGRADRALGFEAVVMGLANADGLTLDRMRDEGLLEDDDMPGEIAIGDDGTGKAARALGWLHTNCGVSCHNSNSSAEAYKTDLWMRLDASLADGKHTDEFSALKTAVGEPATTERWVGQYRIVPGVPEASLLYWLMARRDPEKPDDQMPPIGSRMLDEERQTWVAQWIRSMPRDPSIPVRPLQF